MRMMILGSGTAAPRLKRNMSSYLLEVNNNKVLFDTGPGTIRQLLKINASLLDISHIFYTHLHNDHINDLGAIIWSNNCGDLRKEPLNFFGPVGFKRHYQVLIKHLLKPKLIYKINVKEMKDNSTIKISTSAKVESYLKIKAKNSKHTNSSISYRIEHSNKSVVYSGDTDYSNEIAEISKNADLLILECSFPDGKKVKGHLTPSLCGKIAAKANVKKLVLTHFYPECDMVNIKEQCRKEFKGNVVLARDFMEVEV